jgi:hypothetical protein
LDLKSADEAGAIEELSTNPEGTADLIAEIDSAICKIDEALPMVRDLDAADKELDDLADLSRTTFEDLISLSMNVEPRYSGPIIQSAATLLGHAITAKQTKIDKKLKMIDLQLKKAGLDQKERALKAKTNPIDEAEDGQGVVLDRNALLKQILGKTKEP